MKPVAARKPIAARTVDAEIVDQLFNNEVRDISTRIAELETELNSYRRQLTVFSRMRAEVGQVLAPDEPKFTPIAPIKTAAKQTPKAKSKPAGNNPTTAEVKLQRKLIVARYLFTVPPQTLQQVVDATGFNRMQILGMTQNEWFARNLTNGTYTLSNIGRQQLAAHESKAAGRA